MARWRHPRYGAEIRVEHWDNAARHGDTAARTLLDGPAAPPFDAVTMFWSHQHDIRLHVLGHISGTDDFQLIEGNLDAGGFVAAYGRAGVVSGLLFLNSAARIPVHRGLVRERSAFPVPLALQRTGGTS